MTPPIVISIAGEPVGKGRPRFARATGHAYTPEKTKNYETTLRLAAQDVMAGLAPLDGPVEIEVVARFGIAASWSKKKAAQAEAGALRPTKKPDASNIAKAAEDGLNEIVFRDDSQIVKSTIIKEYSRKPGLTITVRPAQSGAPNEAR